MLSRMEAGIDRCRDETLSRMMRLVLTALEPYQAGDLVMTDDRAPVELLSMQVIDDLIKDEVAYYKGIYQREGIEGLLNGF